ncbi:hypothetical protein Trydic_g3964 [Trypoxylus dichotomus]
MIRRHFRKQTIDLSLPGDKWLVGDRAHPRVHTETQSAFWAAMSLIKSRLLLFIVRSRADRAEVPLALGTGINNIILRLESLKTSALDVRRRNGNVQDVEFKNSRKKPRRFQQVPRKKILKEDPYTRSTETSARSIV